MTARRTLVRRWGGVAVVILLPVTAACGAGRTTTTDTEHQTPYVASAHAGSLLVTTASLFPAGSVEAAASVSSASPTPSASASAAGGSGGGVTQAYLVAAIANSGGRADILTGVNVQGATVDLGQGDIVVQPHSAIRFGDPDVGDSTKDSLPVSGFAEVPHVGTSLRVTFTFQNAGAVTLVVPVHSSQSYGTTSTTAPVNLTGSYPSATPESTEP